MNRDECRTCAVGQASGEGKGQFCPFIDRQYHKGDVLYSQGDVAGYIWFIRSGAVVLEYEDVGQPTERKTAGGFIGIESLVRERYTATARVADDATMCGATREGFEDWLGPHSQRACVLVRDLLCSPITRLSNHSKE